MSLSQKRGKTKGVIGVWQVTASCKLWLKLHAATQGTVKMNTLYPMAENRKIKTYGTKFKT